MSIVAEPTVETGGVLSPQYRALTVGMVALITLVAFGLPALLALLGVPAARRTATPIL